MHQRRHCGTRVSKPVLVHTEFKDAFLVKGKIRFWIRLPGIQSWFFGEGNRRFCFLYAPAQALWHQGQQTCVGAHKRQRILFLDGKIRFCFCMHQHRYGASRASKPVMVQVLWQQGQQACVGAQGIQSRFFAYGKIRFWIPGQTLNDLQSSVLLSAIATSDI